ncbi:hypothetical protein [Streptomyces avermitilis]|uniref:hypothetical protein n=1 Tax=Streptomyces avermitilis TaxID=33903 RepID=UPI002118E3BC|nr:hypothetical protein [Streptomyces avermitilis]
MTDEANRPIPDFVPNAAEPVREHLAASTDLATFLRQAGTLTLDERRLIAAQALILLEQNYVHLPLKAAMYAVNPVQRLRLLIHRLERQTPQDMPPEWMFHTEMSEIFHSVRDLHTNYLLPEPFVGKIAFLPFLVERYTDQQGAHFMVTQVAEGFLAPGFKPGVEITHWSGIPIAEAVDLAAARFAGSNPEARRSRGVQSLTVRPLRIHLPPFEEWVTISYVDEGGTKREFRENWRVVDNLPAFVDADTVSSVAAAQGWTSKPTRPVAPGCCCSLRGSSRRRRPLRPANPPPTCAQARSPPHCRTSSGRERCRPPPGPSAICGSSLSAWTTSKRT